MIKHIILYLVVFVVLAAVGLGVYYLWAVSLPTGLSNDTEEHIFVIEEGESVDQIASNLKQAGLLKDALVFKVHLYITKKGDKLQAGSYSLNKTMDAKDITAIISGGEVMTDETRVTIVEGLKAEEIADQLAEEDLVDADRFMKLVATHDSRDFLPENAYVFLGGRPVYAGMEGYLFPDTYMFFGEATEEEIIEKMLDNFGLKLSEDLMQEISNQGKTVHEIVTLASVVEKEARKTEDRKILAGIFYNRLEIGMALQSDATVNYITGKSTIQPTFDDLEVESKYNTYKYPGLPPGPICNPSLDAIEAVIYPVETDNMYFITKPDGSSDFSETYEQHLEKKYEYYGN